jgi:hypothetical protein
MNRISIYKITDLDDSDSDAMYYTLKGLREQILNEWYEVWENMPIEETKEKIRTDDEFMFDWLNGWGYDVETILEITEDDFPKS